jgi:hypothetical protein
MVENQDLFIEVCARLKAMARDTFSRHGWPHSLRIGPLVLEILLLLTMICNFVFSLCLNLIMDYSNVNLSYVEVECKLKNFK